MESDGDDFSKVLENSAIERIYVNGGKAYELYHKYAEKQTGIEAVKLLSTSPANAAWSLDRLCKVWKQAIGGVYLFSVKKWSV